MSWNLCLRGAEKLGACAWRVNKRFAATEEIVVQSVRVVPGEWYVRVSGDRMRRVSADVYVADDNATSGIIGARVATLAPCVVNGKLIGGPRVVVTPSPAVAPAAPGAVNKRRRLQEASPDPSPSPPPPLAGSHYLFFDLQFVDLTLANFNDTATNVNTTFGGTAAELMRLILDTVNNAVGVGPQNIWLEANATVSPPGGVQLSYGVYFDPTYQPFGPENNLLDSAKLSLRFNTISLTRGFGKTIGRVIVRDLTRRFLGPRPSPPPLTMPPFSLSPPPPPIAVDIDAAPPVPFETYLGDYADDYESFISPLGADVDMPWIALVGDAVVEVATGGRFVDPGATAYDMHDGAIVPRSVAVNMTNPAGTLVDIEAGVDTSVATKAGAMYTVMYNTTDKAGNVALLVSRTITVVDPCATTVTALAPAPTPAAPGPGKPSNGIGTNGTANGSTANGGTANGTENGTANGTANGPRASAPASTPAPDPALTIVEFTCPGSLAEGVRGRVCSVGGRCPNAAQLLLAAAAAAAPSAGAETPPDVFQAAADVTPPTISLLPRGKAGRTVVAGGIVVETITVNIGTAFVDQGVEAFDTDDGDLTASVSSWGSGNIDTTIVTVPGFPFVIEYTVSDAAGNAAISVRRRVRVVNPCANAPRGPANLVPALCADGTCSVGGVCPVEVLSASELAVKPRPINTNQAPAITLRGTAAAQVPVGIPYRACAVGGALTPGVPCDPGASASDEEDGNLDARVTACAPVDVFSAVFGRIGISACGINTAVPGKHVITFTVIDSAGQSAAVKRTVLVVPLCLGGERVCPKP